MNVLSKKKLEDLPGKRLKVKDHFLLFFPLSSHPNVLKISIDFYINRRPRAKQFSLGMGTNSALHINAVVSVSWVKE